MIKAIKRFLNESRIKEESVWYSRNVFQSVWYSRNVFQSEYYISHSWFGSTPADRGEEISEIIVHDRCYVFSMGTQEKMIYDGWLKETWKDEYRNENILLDWLKENMSGFYNVRGWGNGMGNHGQHYAGLWHVEVYIMRPEDALAFKLQWA